MLDKLAFLLDTFNMNGDLYEGNRGLVMASWVGSICAVVAVLSSIIFFIIQDGRSQREFELKSRPYLAIDSIDGSVEASSTAFKIHIKNSGGLPAKIIYQDLKCGNISADGCLELFNQDDESRKFLS